MPPLGVGRILWMDYPGERGGGKLRPMVILTSRNEIARTKRAFVVVCSTDFRVPLEPDEVLLPFEPNGKCVTKLSRPTVAVCNWTDTVSPAGIPEEDVGGIVPTDVVKVLFERLGKPFVSDRG